MNDYFFVGIIYLSLQKNQEYNKILKQIIKTENMIKINKTSISNLTPDSIHYSINTQQQIFNIEYLLEDL